MIPLDLLATAVVHEQKSRAFYEDQGERPWSDGRLPDLFAYLAEEEARHERWLRDFYRLEGDLAVEPAAPAPPLPRALTQLEVEASAREVLVAAREAEEEAATYYESLLERCSDQKERQLMKTLVEAEREHARKIGRLMIK